MLWPGGDNLGTLFHLVDRTHDSTGFGVSQFPKWPIVLHSRLAGIAGSGGTGRGPPFLTLGPTQLYNQAYENIVFALAF